MYAGSWYGFMRAKPWEHPTKTSSIPRQIPPQPWYLHSVQGTILTGLAPFAVLFIELLFVFKNLWQDKSGYYYVFGFLSAVTTILMITVSEVTIIATYSQLCAEVSSPENRDFETSRSRTQGREQTRRKKRKKTDSQNRITTGGGRVSLRVEAAHSGSSLIAFGTTISTCTSRDSYQACSFSAIASLLALCTAC